MVALNEIGILVWKDLCWPNYPSVNVKSMSKLETSWVAVWHQIEGGDKWVMSKFRRTTILRPFFDIFERLPKTQNFFFEKLPPCTAKTVFENPKGPPFGCWKKKFFESSFYQSHVVAFVLTIPKWYNTWVLQIFFVNIWSKIFFKIFFPI